MTRSSARRSMGRWVIGTGLVGVLAAGVALWRSPAEANRTRARHGGAAWTAEIQVQPGATEPPGEGSPVVAAGAEPSADPSGARERDPLRAVMAVESEGPRFVIDVAAVRDSAPGQAILRCLPKGDRRDLARLREEAGLRPFEQIDRVAVVDELAVLTGDFAEVDWSRVEERPLIPQPYGTHGTLYLPGEDQRWRRGFATWKHTVAIGGGRRPQLEAAIDRLEGRAPLAAPMRAVGDASGVVSAAAVFEMLDLGRDVAGPLGSLLKERDAQVRFRVDAGDWGLKVNVELIDGDVDSAEALSTGVEAAANGGVRESERETLGPILAGLAMARPSSGDVRLTLPITLGMLQGTLGECATEGTLPR